MCTYVRREQTGAILYTHTLGGGEREREREKISKPRKEKAQNVMRVAIFSSKINKISVIMNEVCKMHNRD